MSSCSHPHRFAAVVLLVIGGAVNAADGRERIIQRPKFDPAAERVELFAGLEQGALAARMMPRDETGGSIFIENRTSRPLTVEMPPALVGVQVHPQAQSLLPGDLLSSAGPIGANGAAGGQSAQPVGTGFPGGNGTSGSLSNVNVNVNPNNGPLPNFFSIPAERIVRVEYCSVCLQHGAPTPRRGQIYGVKRVEEFSTDPRLPSLLSKVGKGDLDPKSAQAAAWHVVDRMSWDELQAKRFDHLNAPDTPYFGRDELHAARQIVQQLGPAAALAAVTDSSPAAIKASLNRNR